LNSLNGGRKIHGRGILENGEGIVAEALLFTLDCPISKPSSVGKKIRTDVAVSCVTLAQYFVQLQYSKSAAPYVSIGLNAEKSTSNGFLLSYPARIELLP
jgi:hypothetical protein